MTDETPKSDGSRTPPRRIRHTLERDDRPSEAVLLATAALTNTPLLDLDPLYDAVDPDHLDGLFGDSRGTLLPGESSITFRFNECEVTVDRKSVEVRRSADILRRAKADTSDGLIPASDHLSLSWY